MDPDIYTVEYNSASKMYDIAESGEVIASRVTEGATRAELIDRGLSRESATAKVFVASQHAWQGS
jgi:hypothetical protein